MPKKTDKTAAEDYPLFNGVTPQQIDAWIAEYGNIHVFGCPSDGKKGCYIKPVTAAVLIQTVPVVVSGDIVAQGTTLLASCWLDGNADLLPKNNKDKNISSDFLAICVESAKHIVYAETDTKKGILEVFPKTEKPFFGKVTAAQAHKWEKDNPQTYTLCVLDKDGKIKTGGYFKHPTPYMIAKVQRDLAQYRLYDVGKFLLVSCWLGGDGKLINDISIDAVSAALEVYQLGKLPTVQSWTL